MRALLSTAAFLSLMPVAAGAVVMTFDDLGVGATVHVENGITATTDGGIFEPEGHAHIDDSGTSQPAAIDFTMDGRFRAVSLFLMPEGISYSVCEDAFANEGCTSVDDVPTVRFIGYDGETVVADTLFAMGDASRTYEFDGGFSNLTTLTTTIGFPPLGLLPDGGYGFCDDAPCSHYSFDDLTLSPIAPVPLPATLPLLAGAIAGLGALRRARRASL